MGVHKKKEFDEPKCKDRRKCFARNKNGRCTILTSAYNKSLCPFCKPYMDKDMNGNEYPLELRLKMKEFTA